MNILIAGLGRSGLNLAEYLNKKGHKIWGTDSSFKTLPLLNKSNCFVEYETGGYTNFMDMDFDFLVLSPGIPPSSQVANYFSKKGVPLKGELDVISQCIKSAVSSVKGITGITGTNGKTTTSELTGEIYRACGELCSVCGNNGTAVSKALLSNDNRLDSMVIEMSSFMIDRMGSFVPDIFVILNMRPDHLDRYSDVQEYYNSKFKAALALKAGKTLIFNLDCPVTRAKVIENAKHFIDKGVSLLGFTMNQSGKKLNIPGMEMAFYEQKINRIVFQKSKKSISLEGFGLRGEHNIANALAAVCSAAVREIDSFSIENGLKSFKAVTHRMEPVIDKQYILVINDSKATNVDSTLKAIVSYEENIILVAGGYDKKENMLPLAEEIVQRGIKAVVLLGQTSGKIRQALIKCRYGGEIESADELDSAVEKAYAKTLECYSETQKRGVLLFSPACASYGLFSDFEQRGRLFKECVLKIDQIRRKV